MKQRLLEMQDYRDRDEAEAARLLGTMPPTSPNDVAERRVYARVCARRHPDPRFVRAVVLVAVLLVSTTIFSATLARRWFAGSVDKPPRSTAATQPVAEPKRPAVRLQRQAELMPTQEVGVPTSPIGNAEEGVASWSAAHVDVHRDRPSSPLAGRRRAVVSGNPRSPAEEAPPVEVAVAPPPPEEAALVMAAVRALRREHNPVQAGVLLDGYLKRFPQGVLTEEALAVGIEAAVARQDAHAARSLADQYLGRYPAGRFAGLAHKALGAARP